jgi:hypothetical protein
MLMAFLRVLQTHLPESSIDPAIRDEVYAAEVTAPGLHWRYIGRDPATGNQWTLTMWDTAEQAKAGVPLSDNMRAKLEALPGRERVLMQVVEVVHSYVRSEATAPA